MFLHLGDDPGQALLNLGVELGVKSFVDSRVEHNFGAR